MDEFTIKVDGNWIGVTHRPSGRLYGFAIVDADHDPPVLSGGVQVGSTEIDTAEADRALEVARAEVTAKRRRGLDATH